MTRTTAATTAGLAMALTLSACAGARAAAPGPVPRLTVAAIPAADAAALRERWGVEVLGIHPTAAGAMLDFRWKVLDPEKAAPLFAGDAKAGVVDLDAGEAVRVATSPKLGSMRPRRAPLPGHHYFILFDNSARRLGPGSRVAVVIGDFAVGDLKVE